MIERATDMKKEQLEVQIILHFLLANKGFGINNIRYHFYIVGIAKAKYGNM